MSDQLLLFADREGGFEGWIALADGAVSARGHGFESLPPLVSEETGEAAKVTLIVPGEEVVLHWVELPEGLSPPQAQAAARLMAGELSAQPPEEMHVAAGEEQDGLRCVALVPAARMIDWIERCALAAIDPETVLPEPLLMPVEPGKVLRFDRDPLPLFRGPTDAFSAEGELAALMLKNEVETIGLDRFEQGLADAIEQLPVNLRQGAFARRRRRKVEWETVRRLGLLAALLLLVSVAVQMTMILRTTFSADAIEAEADALAATLPRGQAAAQDTGFSALASSLFDGVRATPNVQLTGLVFDTRGGARASVSGDSAASIAALEQRLEGSGLLVDAAPLRAVDGRQVSELTVRAR